MSDKSPSAKAKPHGWGDLRRQWNEEEWRKPLLHPIVFNPKAA
jgi:hypothetical protein